MCGTVTRNGEVIGVSVSLVRRGEVTGVWHCYEKWGSHWCVSVIRKKWGSHWCVAGSLVRSVVVVWSLLSVSLRSSGEVAGVCMRAVVCFNALFHWKFDLKREN